MVLRREPCGSRAGGSPSLPPSLSPPASGSAPPPPSGSGGLGRQVYRPGKVRYSAVQAKSARRSGLGKRAFVLMASR